MPKDLIRNKGAYVFNSPLQPIATGNGSPFLLEFYVIIRVYTCGMEIWREQCDEIACFRCITKTF